MRKHFGRALHATSRQTPSEEVSRSQRCYCSTWNRSLFAGTIRIESASGAWRSEDSNKHFIIPFSLSWTWTIRCDQHGQNEYFAWNSKWKIKSLALIDRFSRVLATQFLTHREFGRVFFFSSSFVCSRIAHQDVKTIEKPLRPSTEQYINMK